MRDSEYEEELFLIKGRVSSGTGPRRLITSVFGDVFVVELDKP